MTGVGTGADLDASIYSDAGTVFQIDYAAKAVENSGTAIGICCTDGVVVAAEKILVSKMLEPTSNGRCHAIDYQAGCCIAGWVPDGRNIMNRAREEAAMCREQYGTPMLGRKLAARVGEYMHFFTKYSQVRPFGASIILASYSDDGPQLFLADPSGMTAGYHACAVGKAKNVAKTKLDEINFGEITCREAVVKAAKILHEVHDATKDKIYEVEIAWVCKESKQRFVHVPASLIPPKP